MLFCQDFNEQFEGYTQLYQRHPLLLTSCFVRISMNNLKDIHNLVGAIATALGLFCQDFNEQFEGYTQPKRASNAWLKCCFVRISMNNLKDIHNCAPAVCSCALLFCQDFNEQFEGYTQLILTRSTRGYSCFVRISMNNLKDIHNSQA